MIDTQLIFSIGSSSLTAGRPRTDINKRNPREPAATIRERAGTISRRINCDCKSTIMGRSICDNEKPIVFAERLMRRGPLSSYFPRLVPRRPVLPVKPARLINASTARAFRETDAAIFFEKLFGSALETGLFLFFYCMEQ